MSVQIEWHSCLNAFSQHGNGPQEGGDMEIIKEFKHRNLLFYDVDFLVDKAMLC